MPTSSFQSIPGKPSTPALPAASSSMPQKWTSVSQIEPQVNQETMTSHSSSGMQQVPIPESKVTVRTTSQLEDSLSQDGKRVFSTKYPSSSNEQAPKSWYQELLVSKTFPAVSAQVSSNPPTKPKGSPQTLKRADSSSFTLPLHETNKANIKETTKESNSSQSYISESILSEKSSPSTAKITDDASTASSVSLSENHNNEHILRGYLTLASADDPAKVKYRCLVPGCNQDAFLTLIGMKRHLSIHADIITKIGVMSHAISDLKRGYALTGINQYACLFPDCTTAMKTSLEACLHFKVHQQVLDMKAPWMTDVIMAFKRGWVALDMGGSLGVCYCCMWQDCQKTSLTEQGAIKHHLSHPATTSESAPTVEIAPIQATTNVETKEVIVSEKLSPNNGQEFGTKKRKSSTSSTSSTFTPKKINLVLPVFRQILPKGIPPSPPTSLANSLITSSPAVIQSKTKSSSATIERKSKATEVSSTVSTPQTRDESGDEEAHDVASMEPVYTKIEIEGRTLFRCGYPECQKTYTRTFNLRSHYKSHTGDRPFRCSICRSSFLRRSDLRRHQNSHETNEQFKCDRCHMNFTRIDALRRHTKKNESGISPCIRRNQDPASSHDLSVSSNGRDGVSHSLPITEQHRERDSEKTSTDSQMVALNEAVSHLAPAENLVAVNGSSSDPVIKVQKTLPTCDSYTTSALRHLLPEIAEAELTALSAMTEMMSGSFSRRSSVVSSNHVEPPTVDVSPARSLADVPAAYRPPPIQDQAYPHLIDTTMAELSSSPTHIGQSTQSDSKSARTTLTALDQLQSVATVALSISSEPREESTVSMIPLSAFQRLAAELEAVQNRLQSIILPQNDLLGQYEDTVTIEPDRVHYKNHTNIPVRWINSFAFYFRVEPTQEYVGLLNPAEFTIRLVSSGPVNTPCQVFHKVSKVSTNSLTQVGKHMGVMDGFIPRPRRTENSFDLVRTKLQVFQDTVIHPHGMWSIQWISPMTFIGFIPNKTTQGSVDAIYTYDSVREGYIHLFGHGQGPCLSLDHV